MREHRRANQTLASKQVAERPSQHTPAFLFPSVSIFSECKGIQTKRHAPANLRTLRTCSPLSLVSNLNPCRLSTPDFALRFGIFVTQETSAPQPEPTAYPSRSESVLLHGRGALCQGQLSCPWHRSHGEDGSYTSQHVLPYDSCARRLFANRHRCRRKS